MTLFFFFFLIIYLNKKKQTKKKNKGLKCRAAVYHPAALDKRGWNRYPCGRHPKNLPLVTCAKCWNEKEEIEVAIQAGHVGTAGCSESGCSGSAADLEGQIAVVQDRFPGAGQLRSSSKTDIDDWRFLR